ncbi:hypothetical protein CVT25_011922 [Psilocybe cyanescens]|uniref:40S ribosomal protein S24 n=1 Tax=Psilocybe cyanescens TaxID=93625 RepID=A0A409XCK5_PSICY|nr:hypothetical protein CVT25_011922 [Psilocybe cyanescens]
MIDSNIYTTAPVTLRTRRLTTNRLLGRRQFIIDIHHPSRPNVRRKDLVQQLAVLYDTERARVVVFGLRTLLGGGESTGYALIYDDEAAQRKGEPTYRLVRGVFMCSGLVPKPRRIGHHLRKKYGENSEEATEKRCKEGA